MQREEEEHQEGPSCCLPPIAFSGLAVGPEAQGQKTLLSSPFGEAAGDAAPDSPHYSQWTEWQVGRIPLWQQVEGGGRLSSWQGQPTSLTPPPYLCWWLDTARAGLACGPCRGLFLFWTLSTKCLLLVFHPLLLLASSSLPLSLSFPPLSLPSPLSIIYPSSLVSALPRLSSFLPFTLLSILLPTFFFFLPSFFPVRTPSFSFPLVLLYPIAAPAPPSGGPPCWRQGWVGGHSEAAWVEGRTCARPSQKLPVACLALGVRRGYGYLPTRGSRPFPDADRNACPLSSKYMLASYLHDGLIYLILSTAH